jgi:hypothetical protein
LHGARQQRSLTPLFDHLIGDAKQIRGNGEAKCFGRADVDHEFEFSRLSFGERSTTFPVSGVRPARSKARYVYMAAKPEALRSFVHLTAFVERRKEPSARSILRLRDSNSQNRSLKRCAKRERLFARKTPKRQMTEHETAEEAFSNNRERLRAERLAREAIEGPILYPAPELPDDTSIEKVLFSTRIRNALIAAGLKNVGEIREASDATLLGLKDLGKGSVSYLREALGLPSSDGVRPDRG